MKKSLFCSFFVVLLVSLIGGCSSLKKYPPSSPQHELALNARPTQEKALVYLIREDAFTGGGIRTFFDIDGEYWGEIDIGTFLAAKFPPGKHKLTIGYERGVIDSILPLENSATILGLAPENIYYYLFNPGIGGGFEQLSDERQGRKLIVRYDLSGDNKFFYTLTKNPSVSPKLTPNPGLIPVPEKRIALVIGNSHYNYTTRLKNPANDANDMAEVLQNLGFEVILRTDVTREQMGAAISEFGRRLVNGGIGLFYYSGHGLQHKNLNYLIPVDANIKSKADIDFTAVSANYVLEQMEQVRDGVNIVILDACRNTPNFLSRFRNLNKGLARMEAPTGSIIAYATQPGNTAEDGPGRNGTYTKHLLGVLRQKPSLSVLEFFNEVGTRVLTETKHTAHLQMPWVSNSPLPTQFCFKPPCQLN